MAVSWLVLPSGCGQNLDVGSDILWTSRFEVGGNSFPEWTPVPFGFGSASPVPTPNEPNMPNTVEVSSEQGHHSNFAAKLTVSGTADNTAGIGASLVQNGGLPDEAYYSAWYYLPQSVSVGYYWVIMKFRFRSVPDDPNTAGELFDVNLTNPSSGVMSLRLYDHQTPPNQPQPKVSPKSVSVNAWFQLEAFYRAASDNTGQLTLWLDGEQILDLPGPTGPAGWVAWDVVSVGYNLTPEPAVLYVDDCAISRTRIGLNGLLSE